LKKEKHNLELMLHISTYRQTIFTKKSDSRPDIYSL